MNARRTSKDTGVPGSDADALPQVRKRRSRKDASQASIPSDVLKRFGVELREARERANLTQTDVAVRCNMTKGAISKIENGLRLNLELGTIGRLANAVGMSFDLRLMSNRTTQER